VLITAHLEVEPPDGVSLVPVGTALELQVAVRDAAASADLVIMAAAVADYRPERTSDAKIKKGQAHEGLSLELVQNPDILADLAAHRSPGVTLVGFAAETEPDDERLIETARQKLRRKGCDYLVLNRVGWSTGFASERNEVMMLDSAGDIVMTAAGAKDSVADRILDRLV